MVKRSKSNKKLEAMLTKLIKKSHKKSRSPKKRSSKKRSSKRSVRK